jgi:hypothetical protein
MVFCYVPVHNATESFHWDSKTYDKTTAANQHLKQFTPKAASTNGNVYLIETLAQITLGDVNEHLS